MFGDNGLIPKRYAYYLWNAKATLEVATCLRGKYGAVIVTYNRDIENHKGRIVSTGYSGAPRGAKHCSEIFEDGICLRERLGIPSGERYELCRSVHAEQNAIVNAAEAGVSIAGGEMYLYGEDAKSGNVRNAKPCSICKKLIINAGIKKVVARTKAEPYYEVYNVSDWIEEMNQPIAYQKMPEIKTL